MGTVVFEDQTVEVVFAAERHTRPWVCQFCHLINWPVHMDGTPRIVCHKCQAHMKVEEVIS